MDVRVIGYGRASVHDFESTDYREYCYIEADLEPWEDVDESIKVLRQRVCSKVGIQENVDALERRRDALKNEIQNFEDRLVELEAKWNGLKKFSQKVEGLTKDFDPIPF